jgi:tetratricopeptide (TPR) repeat protein
LGLVGSLIATLLINHERRNADDNFVLALSALEETLAEAVAGNLVVGYADPKHKELERRGIEFFEQLARKNNLNPETWLTYRLLVCNQQLEKALQLRAENVSEAETAHQRAIALSDQLHSDDKQEPRYLAKLVNCLDEYSVFLHNLGRSEADEPSRRAAELAEELLASHPDFLSAHYLIGINHYNTGVRLQGRGHDVEAEAAYQTAITHLQRAFELEPTEVRNPYGLAQCKYNLAMIYSEDTAKAETYWQESLRLWKGLILMRPLRSEFHSRAGATLSNLAVLARLGENYELCRSLASEAVVFQKEHALKLEPVYEHAKPFLQKHYHELGLALSSLRDREALAKLADDRVADFPDVASETCEAAMCFGDCLEQLHSDEQYHGEDRNQLVDEYARRALEILDQGSERFDDNRDAFLIGGAYLMLGDGFHELGRTDDARRAWESAERQYKRVQAAVDPKNRHEFDEHIDDVRRRINSIEADNSNS